MSGWGKNSVESRAYSYYQTTHRDLSKSQAAALKNVGLTLEHSTNPRGVLNELYSQRLNTADSLAIARKSESLREIFEPVWEESLPQLEQWAQKLRAFDLGPLTGPVKKAVAFLDATFDIGATYKVYLIQNPDFAGATGHTIQSADSVLVHVPGKDFTTNLATVMSIVLHEIVHMIEFRSKKTESLYDQSYESNTQFSGMPVPAGYTPRSLFREVVVCSFVNSGTRGLLSPEVFNKGVPTVADFQQQGKELRGSGRWNTQTSLEWVALCMMPEFAQYIEQGRQIDRRLTDKIARYIYEAETTLTT